MTLLKKPESKETIVVEPKPLWQILRQGVVVNLLNPKASSSGSDIFQGQFILRSGWQRPFLAQNQTE